MTSRRRVGLLGGTFDPPHLGHATVALDVLRALELDEVRLVPAADPPHKPGLVVASALDRLDMVRAAVEGLEGLVASDVEITRGGVSYTVDTVRALRAAEPDTDLFVIIGADQLAELHTWREPEAVARLASLVVMARDGRDPRDVEVAPGVRVHPVDVTRIDVSSSEIRARVASGKRVDRMVSPGVLSIIRERGLYQTG